jgi:hypothetical protein
LALRQLLKDGLASFGDMLFRIAGYNALCFFHDSSTQLALICSFCVLTIFLFFWLSSFDFTDLENHILENLGIS